MAILLYSMCRAVRLPCRLVISGTDRSGKKVRFVQGEGRPPAGVGWAHIYCQIGDKPYGPCKWYYAEPTMRGVPLGWDVVGANSNAMPEMNGNAYGAAEPAKVDPNAMTGENKRVFYGAMAVLGAIAFGPTILGLIFGGSGERR